MTERIESFVGLRFGRLLVVGEAPRDRGRRLCCLCDCGRATVPAIDGLRRGTSRSCGCLRSEQVAARQRTHGRAAGYDKTPEYNAWQAMKQRCLNPDHPAWANYGGRGITVCDRWLTFENFIDDVGPRPPRGSLDRTDNARGYEPGNVRWATTKEQARNKRSNVITQELASRIRSLGAAGQRPAEIAEAVGVPRAQVGRIVRGERWAP